MNWKRSTSLASAASTVSTSSDCSISSDDEEIEQENRLDFQWRGEPLEMNLKRNKKTSSRSGHQSLVWRKDTLLGITMVKEQTSGCIVVRKVNRDDSTVQIGDILLSVNGKKVSGSNWNEVYKDLSNKNSSTTQVLGFLPCPDRPYISFVRGHLAEAGVKKGYELESINEKSLRYVKESSIMDILADAPKPCILSFYYWTKRCDSAPEKKLLDDSKKVEIAECPENDLRKIVDLTQALDLC